MTLYVSDLDGTLLGPDAGLSPRAARVVRHVIARGVPFTVASARSLASMQQLLGDLPLHLPVIAHNGAVVGHLDGRTLAVSALADAVATHVFDVVREHGVQPILVTHDGAEERLVVQGADNAGQRAYLDARRASGDPRLHAVPDVAVGLQGTVVTFTCIDTLTRLAAIQRALNPHPALHTHVFPDLYAPGWHWLTVHPVSASKALGIRGVIDGWDLAGRRLVVFGDQVNDLSMFELADHAVAVGNAAPSVLAAADEVIGSNADDAVAAYLEARTR